MFFRHRLRSARSCAGDILAEPGENQVSPFRPKPDGSLVMRSYMAVPVVARTGNINGVLVFGHEKTRFFTERSEQLMQGLAAQTAIALENGRLYQAAQYEIEERKQSQAQQSLLIRELHHRVKNTLATVQAVVGATARSTTNIDEFYQAFVARIISLANTYSLLTEAVWQTAPLREILEGTIAHYDSTGERITIRGPAVELPSEAAVPIGMAIHELTTNAGKIRSAVDGGRTGVCGLDLSGGRRRDHSPPAHLDRARWPDRVRADATGLRLAIASPGSHDTAQRGSGHGFRPGGPSRLPRNGAEAGRLSQSCRVMPNPLPTRHANTLLSGQDPLFTVATERGRSGCRQRAGR